MMDIDFIKWMCEKAEGFEFNEGDFVDDNYVTTPAELDIDMLHDISSDLWIKGYYPLLLQRAIEGVNREDNVFRVEQMYDCIDILDAEEYTTIIRHDLEDYINNDSAKESALRYIYEQERDK